MQVKKRNGKLEEMKFDKVTERIKAVQFGLGGVDPQKIALKVIEGLFEGVETQAIDTEIAETAAALVTTHPDYGQLAANVSVSNLHKKTCGNFSELMNDLYFYVNPKTGKHSPIVSEEVKDIATLFALDIEGKIDYQRDYSYDFFGFKTLERSYLLKENGVIAERPQDMLMRVSLGIHGEDLEQAFITYDLMSLKYFTHATPTLFNAGTPTPQMSSCFLIDMKEDSIEGIYDTLKISAQISKGAGGIGITAHKVRASGSYIAGTNGTSNGIVPMLQVFNQTARYVDQGGGKRKGSFAVYLEPWHADIFDFLDLKKNHGKEEMRARDLFYAMWLNDEFMKQVKKNESWFLMCPSECIGMDEVFGAEFAKLYWGYVKEGKFVKEIKARDLWEKILESQMETGTPYMLHKDHINKKSNQKNLGTIKSSNLCTEIVEFTSPDEVAVCNLASISLPAFFTDGAVNYSKLYSVAYQVTKNLNKVIDVNYYPVKEAKNSNLRHRPIGIGVQGLADLFILLRLPFTSVEAKEINKNISEVIYFAALTASKDLAKVDGTYLSYEGSPISRGLFQFDLWGVESDDLSGLCDWRKLRGEIKKHGVRNSLLVAPMPTASTSQILGNNEAFEPYTTNIFTRRVLAGEYIVVNKHLIKDLINLGVWGDKMRQDLMRENGSVQNIKGIPEDIKALYKTVWEMSMKDIIDMSADRGVFVDQSQSLNLFMSSPSVPKLTSMHFYAWEKGLKTGMYYLRTKAAVQAKQFTLEVKVPIEEELSEEEAFKQMVARSREAANNGDDCDMCGS